VPDAPVTRFALSLFGGRRGLLVNSKDLCQTNRRIDLDLVAHNGRSRSSHPVVASTCGKPRRG
jgi:hypothetical protein